MTLVDLAASGSEPLCPSIITEMGFEPVRFLREHIPDDLFCPECHQVLQDAVQCKKCQHLVCFPCLSVSTSCMHQPTEGSQAAAFTRHKVGQLVMRCVNSTRGCDFIAKAEVISNHESRCAYMHNAVNLATCEKGCGATLHPSDVPDHNCVQYLLLLSEAQDLAYNALEQNLQEVRKDTGNLREKLELLKTAQEGRIHELKLALQSGEEELDQLRVSYDRQAKLFESDTKTSLEQYREAAQGKVKTFVKVAEDRMEALHALMYEEMRQFMNRARELQADFNTKMREDFLDLHSPGSS